MFTLSPTARGGKTPVYHKVGSDPGLTLCNQKILSDWRDPLDEERERGCYCQRCQSVEQAEINNPVWRRYNARRRANQLHHCAVCGKTLRAESTHKGADGSLICKADWLKTDEGRAYNRQKQQAFQAKKKHNTQEEGELVDVVLSQKTHRS